MMYDGQDVRESVREVRLLIRLLYGTIKPNLNDRMIDDRFKTGTSLLNLKRA
jgi:hypothetical protein